MAIVDKEAAGWKAGLDASPNSARNSPNRNLPASMYDERSTHEQGASRLAVMFIWSSHTALWSFTRSAQLELSAFSADPLIIDQKARV